MEYESNGNRLVLLGEVTAYIQVEASLLYEASLVVILEGMAVP
jgi:hypothetical protein